MARMAHWLKANRGIELPVHMIFVDTETRSYEIRPDTVQARLWFGWACYVRRYKDQTWSEPQWCKFRNRAEFWL